MTNDKMPDRFDSNNHVFGMAYLHGDDVLYPNIPNQAGYVFCFRSDRKTPIEVFRGNLVRAPEHDYVSKAKVGRTLVAALKAFIAVCSDGEAYIDSTAWENCPEVKQAREALIEYDDA